MRRRTPMVAVLLAACTGAAGGRDDSEAVSVRHGVDRLADDFPQVLIGKRLGLITNHTGHDRARTPTIDILFARSDAQLVALFAPEHGIRGVATGRIADDVDEKTGLPVRSLYGQTRRPTPEMLQDIDALVFDIQDVGVRQYTYISTMGEAMIAAAEKGIPFVVLDRVNPIGGDIVEGNILEPQFASFVGMYPIASRHGMTVGEIAQLFNTHFGIHAQLEVVKLEGWQRSLWFDDTDLPWTGPSPNLPLFSGTISYPGTVLFEGTNLSEGRGTDLPFEQTGAPWLKSREVTDAMNALNLPGVRFEEKQLIVREGARKYGGQTIPGVRYIVTDRNRYRPIYTTLHLMQVVRRLQPNEFEWRSATFEDGRTTFGLDRLAGTDRVRKVVEEGSVAELVQEWERDAQRFRELRRPYLLY